MPIHIHLYSLQDQFLSTFPYSLFPLPFSVPTHVNSSWSSHHFKFINQSINFFISTSLTQQTIKCLLIIPMMSTFPCLNHTFISLLLQSSFFPFTTKWKGNNTGILQRLFSVKRHAWKNINKYLRRHTHTHQVVVHRMHGWHLPALHAPARGVGLSLLLFIFKIQNQQNVWSCYFYQLIVNWAQSILFKHG